MTIVNNLKTEKNIHQLARYLTKTKKQTILGNILGFFLKMRFFLKNPFVNFFPTRRPDFMCNFRKILLAVIYWLHDFCLNLAHLCPLKGRILQQPSSWKVQVCLSICDLSIETRHLRVKGGKVQKISELVSLNSFVPNALFLYTMKMFSGGRERVHWEQMG